MEDWRKPQHFVPRDNSEKERRLKKIHEHSKLQAENLQYKRQLEAALMENTILKKARSKTEAYTEIDKVERDRAQLRLTHDGQIADWSKQLIRLQDCLKSLDKEEDHLVSIRNDFKAETVPPNLPRHLKALECSPDVKYPEVLSVARKAQIKERLWKYRSEVLQDAFDNLADKRKGLDRESKDILVAVEGALGKKATEAFKKKCVDMALRRRTSEGKKDTPNFFEIFPWHSRFC